MNTLVEANELQDAAGHAQQCQLTYENLLHQRSQQIALVSQLSADLRDLLIARKWDAAETPADAAESRLECTEVAERLRVEEQLLAAMDAAIRNAEAEVLSAGNRVQGVISQLVFAQFSRTGIDSAIEKVAATG